MTVTFINGLEAGHYNLDNFTGAGTTEYSTAQARTGAVSFRCNPASAATGYMSSSGLGGNYVHFGMYVVSLPSVNRLINGVIGLNQVNTRLTSTGALAVYLNTTLLGTSSTAFASPGWHWVGLRRVSGTSVVFLQIDGINEVTGTATATSLTTTLGMLGSEASAVDVYFDDIIVDNTGFLAPSKVALLLPISDNARSTQWTGGALATTNLFDAVNNTPPVGTATETDLTQIEHAGGATGDYDANMTTYATVGVGASDTVLALYYTIVHGEDIATGTKLLNFSLASNPTQASGLANFTAGADIGALGTYPTNWTITHNTIITSPTVTVGTSPVMRVTRPETASRVASVCFMGMYVAWTPAAVVARVPYSTPYRQLLAH